MLDKGAYGNGGNDSRQGPFIEIMFPLLPKPGKRISVGPNSLELSFLGDFGYWEGKRPRGLDYCKILELD
jgi:hypothetical protein